MYTDFMNKEQLEKKRSEVEAKFEELKTQRQEVTTRGQEIDTELVKLQGDYRALTELIEELEPKKEKKNG